MNLFERFWQTVEDKRERGCNWQPAATGTDLGLAAMQAPRGVQSEAALDLAAVVRRAPKRYPPVLVTQPQHAPQPVCLICTVRGGRLPEFHELFEQYIDKNGYIAETFLRLKPHCDIPYLLFIGERTFFFYDTAHEELLKWGADFASLEELFLAPFDRGENLLEIWGGIPRKTLAQRSEEFTRWLDLWRAAIGARTNANPNFMTNLMQKVILLFLFDLGFGLEDPDLRLRTNFLDLRAASPKRGTNGVQPPPVFDGIAWLHEASGEVRMHFALDFLFWSQAESNFFALMGADARRLFSQFILELFLLSASKYDSAVQADAFSDANSRLKLWKYSVTETLNIRQRLQADEVNVYEPIHVDLEDSGVGWALHIIEQTLDFWRVRCETFARQLSERRRLEVQFDMFQQPDPEHARIPELSDVFATAFATSLRIHYELPALRSTLEYLIILKVFELCRKWNLPLQPLDVLAGAFVRKEPQGGAREG
jgi:hypothetical protein